MANSRVGSELQPVAGTGDMGGVDAVGRAKFGNGFGEVVTDGAFGEAEFGGDLCGGATVAGALKDLAFADRREGLRLRSRPRRRERDRRREDRSGRGGWLQQSRRREAL